MSVLLLAGTADERSRCSTLLDTAGEQLQARLAHRLLYVDRLHIRNLSPQAMLLADTGNSSVLRALKQIDAARALVVAASTTHGTFSGVLKLLLDLLPPGALRGKWVLPVGLAAQTSDLHTLDTALKQVFKELDAVGVLPGVYALDHEVPLQASGRYQPTELLTTRLDKAVQHLVSLVEPTVPRRFSPILLEPNQLSV